MYQRGDIHWGILDPRKGSEQAACRPVLIFQDLSSSDATNTVVIIPFTSKLQWARLPTTVFVPAAESGLPHDSIALCHQIRVLAKEGIGDWLGRLTPRAMEEVEDIVLLTLGLASP